MKRLFFISLIGLIAFSLAQTLFAQENDVRPPQKGLLWESPVVQQGPVVGQTMSTIIFQETFEGSTSGWSTSGSWGMGIPTSGPNSGYNSQRCAATNLSGNYGNNANDWLISPTISLTGGGTASRFTLSFMEWFQIESGYDFGYVKISTNGGISWTTLNTRDGGSGWRQLQIDLTSYSNSQIKLAFNLTSDGSVTYPGWYIDDIQVVRQDPEPLTVTLSSLNSQNFPFVYMNVAVDTFGRGFPGLVQSNFRVYENNILQTDLFSVVPPNSGGGVRLADIVFVLDVTGSMTEEIASVKANMLSFVTALASSSINYGIGVVVFGDIVYTYNNGSLYFNQSQILSIINGITLGEHGIGSGGDIPENQLGAMYAATLMNYRPGAQRVQIMITDAHAHENDPVTPWTVSSLIPVLQAASITVFPVFDVSRPEQTAQYIPIAQATNPRGTYFNVYSNFNTIINEIQSAVANSYVVSYRSSDPTLNGVTRNVRIEATYGAYSDTATGSYVPGSAPSIQRTSATIVLHNQPWAEGTTFTIEADITDNVPPLVQTARLYYRRTGVATYSSVAMTRQTGDTYRGVIPGSVVQTPGLDYYITATDGQTTSSDPRTDPANNPYQFGILPNVAPVITHTPVTTLTPGSPITITANIVDNTNLLSAARLYYRKAGQLLYQQATMTSTGGSNYQAVIPSTYVTNDGVDYYIYAVDNFGVSSTFATLDVPISLRNPMSYINEKDALISFFRGEGFYANAEQNAQTYVDRIRQKVNNGTQTSKEVESIRRLTLVEEAARVAYTHIDTIASLTAQSSIKAIVSIIFESLFGTLEKVLRPFKDYPLISALYESVKGAKDWFGGFFSQTFGRVYGELTKQLIPDLVARGLTYSEASNIASTLVREVELPFIRRVTKFDFEQLINLTPVQNAVKDLYKEIYGVGLPLSVFPSIGIPPVSVFWTGGSTRAITNATNDAISGTFTEGDIDAIARNIRTNKEPDIAFSNTSIRDLINATLRLAGGLGTASFIILVVVMLASLIAAIVGIPIGGVGAIPGLLGFLVSLGGLVPYLAVGQIFLYAGGIVIGNYQLDFNMPGKLDNVYEIAFERAVLESHTNSEVAVRDDRQNLGPIPAHWADSLTTTSNAAADNLENISSLIQLDRWDDITTELRILSARLDTLLTRQRIVTSILDASYLGNGFGMTYLDSVYLYTASYTASSNFGMAITLPMIGYATLTKPVGARRDSVVQTISSTVSLLRAQGARYRQTFDYFNSVGYQTPPIVSIVGWTVSNAGDIWLAQARIKNISGLPSHEIVASLSVKSDSTIRISVRALEDTVVAQLNPSEEAILSWQMTSTSSSPKGDIVVVDLNVHSKTLPGDFQGDRISSHHTFALSSPSVPGPLGNQNIYAYPNPFNPDVESAMFRFKLAKDGNVTITVYDVSNAKVKEVISAVHMSAAVEQSVAWNGRNERGNIVGNGVYFYIIESSSGERAVGKIAVLR